MSRKWIYAATLILAAFVTSASAHGRWRGGGHGMKKASLSEQLELSAEQQVAWDELKATSKEQRETLREEHRAAFQAILTPEQLTALKELRGDGRRRHRCRRGSLVEILGLTPEQQTAWDELKTAMKDAKEALREERRAAFEEILDAEQLALLEEIRSSRTRHCWRDTEDAEEPTEDAEELGDNGEGAVDTQTLDAALLGIDAGTEAATAVQETSWGTIKDVLSR